MFAFRWSLCGRKPEYPEETCLTCWPHDHLTWWSRVLNLGRSSERRVRYHCASNCVDSNTAFNSFSLRSKKLSLGRKDSGLTKRWTTQTCTQEPWQLDRETGPFWAGDSLIQYYCICLCIRRSFFLQCLSQSRGASYTCYWKLPLNQEKLIPNADISGILFIVL